MTNGNLITADHQYEFNNLLIGSGTEYITSSWDGMFDIAPDLRSNDLDRNDTDGVVPGLDFAGGRSLTGDVKIKTYVRTDVWSRMLSMSTAYQRRTNTEIPFYFRHPMTNGEVWYINCRPRKYAIKKDADVTLGLAQVALMLYASRPEYYSLTTQSAAANQATNGTSSTATCINSGNFPTKPVITLTGYAPAGTSVAVSGQTPLDGGSDNGLSFVLKYGLATTDVLEIDMKNKTVKLNGNLRAGYKIASSNWWRMLPQSNTVTVTRPSADGNALNVNIAWQNAWMV